MHGSADGWVKFRARIFKALGDYTRLRIIYFLQEGEKCVSDIVSYVGYVQPTVSRHLRVLTDCGILRVRKDGNKRLYSITDVNIFKTLHSLDVRLMRSLSEKLIRRITPAVG